MKLTEISLLTSKLLNEKMFSHVGWNLKLEGLTKKSATRMLESVNSKLRAVKLTHKVHVSESDLSYNGMLLAKNVLETYIREQLNESYDIVHKTTKQVLDTLPSKDEALDQIAGMPEKDRSEYVVKPSPKSREKKDWSMNETSKDKLEKYIDSAITDHGHANFAANNSYGKEKDMWTKRAANRKKGISTAIKSVDAKTGQIIKEDQVTQAQSVMAAKDMVDTIQGMLEDVSKLAVEQLPPLSDSIRSSIGDQQATAFNSAVQSALTTLQTTLQTTREQVNSAVLGLTGESQPMNMSQTSVPSADDLDIDNEMDDFSAADSASGGAESLGRKKRD